MGRRQTPMWQKMRINHMETRFGNITLRKLKILAKARLQNPRLLSFWKDRAKKQKHLLPASKIWLKKWKPILKL